MGTHPIFESDFDCLTVATAWKCSAGVAPKGRTPSVKAKARKATDPKTEKTLLLENHNEKPNAESEKEAEELAKFTLQLTKQLKDIATGTRDIIKDDRTILKDMDSKMESNLANLV